MYTTQLQAGQGLVAETRTLLELWEEGMGTQDLYRVALTSGSVPRVTGRRLRNIVAECFAPRYLVEDARPARNLKRMIATLSPAELKLLFLVYTCRANQILGDFVSEVYWPRYAGGYSDISKDEAERFVLRAIDEGKTIKRWSPTTVRRVSAYVLGTCGDYGLLSAASRGVRKIQQIRVTPTVVAYVAHELHFSGAGDTALASAVEWRWLGMEPRDVTEELKRVGQRGWLIVQSAADLTQISWRFKDMEELIDAVAH